MRLSSLCEEKGKVDANVGLVELAKLRVEEKGTFNVLHVYVTLECSSKFVFIQSCIFPSLMSFNRLAFLLSWRKQKRDLDLYLQITLNVFCCISKSSVSGILNLSLILIF